MLILCELNVDVLLDNKIDASVCYEEAVSIPEPNVCQPSNEM